MLFRVKVTFITMLCVHGGFVEILNVKPFVFNEISGVQLPQSSDWMGIIT